ncbi:MAG TPA: phospholipid carrier-dependent glycosyltransferase [Ktedonobacteraceae bacterium]|nr:phospholipid carrier-dependent glycosyltransferase [Ktedonobacteraceae bacterium]
MQQQPPQEQQGQGRSLSIRRKNTPVVNPAEQVQAVNAAHGQRPVDYLPTVTLPAPNNTPASGPGQNGMQMGSNGGNSSNGGNAATPLNRVQVPPTPHLPAPSAFPPGSQAPPSPAPAIPPIPRTPAQAAVISPAQMAATAPVAPPLPGQPPQLPPGARVQQPQIVGNNVILHRGPNFFVRTTYRPGQRPTPLRRPSGYAPVMPKVMPQQEQRIAASDTKLMPAVAPINPVKTKKLPVPPWLEALVITIGLLVAAVAHALNMFNFPRYELDEGTYISNAWAILHGELSPYAYGYGHPPLAWIQIAAWLEATGSLFSFGDAINSGRVLMLLYALGSALLVYLIARRLGGSRTVALLAMVIFSLSPISLTYQRQVLLDNVGTFWLLLALYLIIASNSRLLYIALGGICFGIAFLSKEIFILFLPVMIYATWLHTTKFQRKFILVAFTYAAIAICSMFVLMAVLKGELFPTGWLPGDTHPHLSLIGTYIGQIGRGQSQGGSITGSMTAWAQADMVFVVLSIAATIFNLALGWWNRKLLLLSLMALSFWVLLLRGGVVFPFYIIPMIPLVALNAAMAADTITGWIGKLVRFDLIRAVLILGMIAAILSYYATDPGTGIIFTQHPTSAQTQALAWIRENVPTTDVIVINSYLYTDLHSPAGVGGGEIYPHADVYQNVATDPTIYQDVLQNNWDRIDYIVADSEMLQDIKGSGSQMQIITDALNHSILRATFSADDHSDQLVIQVFQVIHKIPPEQVLSPNGGNGNQLALMNDANSAWINPTRQEH